MLTHFRNAVPLVWGLLRLAPIIDKKAGFLVQLQDETSLELNLQVTFSHPQHSERDLA